MPRLRVTFRMVALGVALFGIGSRIALSVMEGRFWYVMGYFTVQSNLMVCLYYGIALGADFGRYPGRFTGKLPGLHGAVLLYIAITGLVYNILLAPASTAAGFDALVIQVNHTATPLLFLVDWILRQKDYAYRTGIIWPWLAYPIAYFAYGSIEGAAKGAFRYFFLDFSTRSAGSYALWMAVVFALFFAVGFALIGTNRLTSRRSRGA